LLAGVQFARLVREALCELELPYILHNTGKGSGGRAALLKIKGDTQVGGPISIWSCFVVSYSVSLFGPHV
jgi:hypothetical protein